MGMASEKSLNDTTTQNASNASDRIDVVALMAEIRVRIKQDVENNRDKRLEFKPRTADIQGQEAKRADEIVNSEELRNINRQYAYSAHLPVEGIQSHRPGVLGQLIVKCKRRLVRWIWESLLKDYLVAEREYQTNVVRFLNDISRYIGSRDSSVFWELIRKIDYDVGKALERIERINDEQTASLRAMERGVLEAVDRALVDLRKDGRVDKHASELRTLHSVVSGLESIVAKLPAPQGNPRASEQAASNELVQTGGYSYLLLENRFRGSEAQIAEHVRIYPPLFAGSTGPVLEIGSGRGELLKQLNDAGLKAYGVDLDPAMVQAARAKGLNVLEGDGIAHLRSLPDRSLGGLIAVQVVEHLPRLLLEELFKLAASKVQSGGKVVFETINPRSLLALSSNYFRDPTHVWPLHPDTLEYSASLSGLKVKEVRVLSPIPGAAKLQQIQIDEDFPPRLAFALERVNQNIAQLNNWLYAEQDYCIIAEA
jgi:2-polyprenyl-3-methyl-5-hydroxy-6-metoxy-1,4-benzoquinol methylase